MYLKTKCKTEAKKSIKNQKKRENVRYLIKMTKNNIWIIETPEGEKNEKGKTSSKGNIAEIFPILWIESSVQI